MPHVVYYITARDTGARNVLLMRHGDKTITHCIFPHGQREKCIRMHRRLACRGGRIPLPCLHRGGIVIKQTRDRYSRAVEVGCRGKLVLVTAYLIRMLPRTTYQ